MTQNELQELKDLIGLLNRGVSKEDFVSNFSQLIDFVQQLKQRNEEHVSLMQVENARARSELSHDAAQELAAAKTELMKTIARELTKALTEQETGMKFIYDKVSTLQDGVDGEDGADGHTPTRDELLSLITPLIPKVENGKDAEVDVEGIVAQVLAKIPRQAGRAGWGAHPLVVAQSGTIKEKTARHINFKGTGVSSVVRNPDGTVDVTITGAAGSLSVLAATGTIDDSNVTFTFASTPTLVIVNGATYRDGHGCTIVTTTVTLDNPVGSSGDIYALG